MTCDQHMDLGPGREWNEGMNVSARHIMAMPGAQLRPVCLACQLGVPKASVHPQ